MLMMKKTNVDLQLKSKTYLIKYAIGNFIKSYYRYHRCIGEFHITLIDRIKQKLSMITAMEEINNVFGLGRSSRLFAAAGLL